MVGWDVLTTELPTTGITGNREDTKMDGHHGLAMILLPARQMSNCLVLICNLSIIKMSNMRMTTLIIVIVGFSCINYL